jgi:sterol desaturase/sphingolipid hydroxylase (fatty acid hydroxylase superfamily)
MSRAISYVCYPLLVAAAISAFAALLDAGLPLIAATNLPILVVALTILALEQWFPERFEWRPRRADVAADAAFMAFVQVLLPRALTALAVFAIASWTHEHAQSPWWPHDWALAAQILAMVLAVDFMRYWVHRACHTWPPLWRLHEVHHSPDVLYALNVGRFHPLEKVLHFACDSVPFLLLGVAPKVIGGYFLLYAVNGFFQHSNLRLRYGWLNYLVGSAETHRWHHARDPKKAYCNFGNTTIVWDLVFGTWHLPKKGTVDDIGIPNRAYPKGFRAQMLAPFRAAPSRHRFMRHVADAVMPWYLRVLSIVQRWRIARAARDPMRTQNALLAKILRENSNTRFGRQRGFAAIADFAGYRRAVAVMEFEALRPFIDSEIERGESALTREVPLQYLRTSGSTGRPKDIPLTPSYLRALRAIQRRSVGLQYRICPDAFAGSILAVISPAQEGLLTNGKSYGAASGIVAAGTPALVKEKFVLPAEVLEVAEARLKYLLILRLAIAQCDVTYFGSANSTTPLALIKLYREEQAALIADLRSGGFHREADLPATTRAALRGRLRANPARARQLEELQTRGRPPRIADLWPALRMVVTWTCGSAGVTVKALREELDPRTRIFELGYVASEFRGTVTLGRRAATGFPTLDTHFFEFVERDRWDQSRDRGAELDANDFLTLDKLRKGLDYYIIVTTPAGLYRYFINDVVRVTGFLQATPLFKFMQKGRGVTNITGEKIYESQVLAAVTGALAEFNLNARFVMMLADEAACGYWLYVEPDAAPPASAARLAQSVDARLKKLNLEYEGKRVSERLAALNATWLRPETGEAYKKHCVAQGQREGQFKCPALAYRKTFDFDLGAYGV